MAKGIGILLADGYDLSALGLIVSTVTGWRSTPAFSSRTRAVPGVPGVVRTSFDRIVASRPVTIQAVLDPPPGVSLIAALDDIKFRLNFGAVTLQVKDEPTTELDVELLGIDESPTVVGQYVTKKTTLTIRLEALQPYRSDRVDTIVALTAGASVAQQRCPLGTAPVGPLIIANGPFTNLSVQYLSALGGVLQTLTLATTIVGGQDVRIDCAAKTIIRTTGGGAIVNAIATIASGDFPILDPSDGSYSTGLWPRLSISAPSSTVTYRKQWL